MALKPRVNGMIILIMTWCYEGVKYLMSTSFNFASENDEAQNAFKDIKLTTPPYPYT